MSFSHRHFYGFRGAISCASVLFAFTLVQPVLAAEPNDSAPKLISATRGKNGAHWSTVAELKKAADANDPRACAQYGDMLLRGDDTPQDIEKAMAYLQKAVDGGEPNAAFRLGKTYYDGEFVPRDYARAFSFYSTAAKAGVVEAQYNLGVTYVGAHGVKRDYVEGLAWLIVATKNGAAGDGEKQVREQLQKTNLQKKIASAEQRAAEILKDPKAVVPGGAAPAVVDTPQKTQAPAKIDLGPTAPTKITIAQPIAPLPDIGKNLSPSLPPSSPDSPADANGAEEHKAQPKKSP
jgi:hypothetical protein